MFIERTGECESDYECVSPINNNHDPLIRRKKAARYLDVSHGTMAVWDCTKRYDLKPVKIGNAVYYRKSVLDAFLEERIRP